MPAHRFRVAGILGNHAREHGVVKERGHDAIVQLLDVLERLGLGEVFQDELVALQRDDGDRGGEKRRRHGVGGREHCLSRHVSAGY